MTGQIRPGVTTLGIIAGGGVLPRAVAEAARAGGRDVFVVALEGQADPRTLAGLPHAWARMGAAGAILSALRAHGCAEVTMIGRVRRPSLREVRLDAVGARLLPRIAWAFAGGDDTLLSAVARLFESEGLRVIGAETVLTGVVAPAGALTRATPDAAALVDVARGRAVATALGALDVGQGCVVRDGIVLAVEAAEGTDAMLDRVAALNATGGGVLVKWVKPGQDRRIDLPTVGPATVARAARAGLRGIAVSAGAAMLAEREEMVAAADAAGLFVVGIAEDGGGTGA